MATPAVTGGFTVLTGDTATASYLNSLCQSIVTIAGASKLTGNPTGSTAQTWSEIGLTGNLTFTTGNLDTIQAIQTTSSPTFAGLTVNGSPTITGTATIGSLSLGTVLSIANGGTGVNSKILANQSLTPATVVYASPGASQAVNWASGSSFYITLSANLTITFSNAVDGQVIVIAILNTASNYTVTWPTVKWQSATAPTMTTGAKYDLYSFVYNSTVGGYLGSYVQNLS